MSVLEFFEFGGRDLDVSLDVHVATEDFFLHSLFHLIPNFSHAHLDFLGLLAFSLSLGHLLFQQDFVFFHCLAFSVTSSEFIKGLRLILQFLWGQLNFPSQVFVRAQ